MDGAFQGKQKYFYSIESLRTQSIHRNMYIIELNNKNICTHSQENIHYSDMVFSEKILNFFSNLLYIAFQRKVSCINEFHLSIL